jgi:hypothetical protein
VIAATDAAHISSKQRLQSKGRVLGVGEPADEFPDVEDGPKTDRLLPPRAAAWLRLYANATIPYHAMAEYNIQKLHGPNVGAEYASIKQPHADIYHYDHQNEVKVIVVGAGLFGREHVVHSLSFKYLTSVDIIFHKIFAMSLLMTVKPTIPHCFFC